MHGKPITETIFYEDPSSPTQLAAKPAPVITEDKTQPRIGKTVEYQIVVEKTPNPEQYPEPTNGIGAGYDAKPYDAKPTGRAEYDDRQYAEVDENASKDETAYTTIRRTTSPGVRPPRGWW
jgi:hypothetical protein